MLLYRQLTDAFCTKLHSSPSTAKFRDFSQRYHSSAQNRFPAILRPLKNAQKNFTTSKDFPVEVHSVTAAAAATTTTTTITTTTDSLGVIVSLNIMLPL